MKLTREATNLGAITGYCRAFKTLKTCWICRLCSISFVAGASMRFSEICHRSSGSDNGFLRRFYGNLHESRSQDRGACCRGGLPGNPAEVCQRLSVVGALTEAILEETRNAHSYSSVLQSRGGMNS